MSWTREDKRTYKCCPCCSDAPDDHPGGIRDWHTIHWRNLRLHRGQETHTIGAVVTAPDPGLTDLIAAEAAVELRNLATEHRLTADRLLALARKISPPCGDWADGHSSRKCDLPKGHEGHHG